VKATAFRDRSKATALRKGGRNSGNGDCPKNYGNLVF
jgi:hypothetical protein